MRRTKGGTDVTGEFVTVPGLGEFYRIANYDELAPFFMSIVSSSDCWLFVSSTGGLTAGRRNQDHALFPYTAEDKIHDSAEVTGSKTIMVIERGGKRFVWEPFSIRGAGSHDIRRNIYKSVWANVVLFEEENRALKLRFRYSWTASGKFGLLRTASLVNESASAWSVRILDGIQNILPSGVESRFQMEKSNLLDAYKKNELLPESGLGLFTLSSIPIDRPEPAESLRATTVWSTGLPRPLRLISSRQIDEFRRGGHVEQEHDMRAARGAYFVCSRFALGPKRKQEWVIGADLDQGPAQVQFLHRELRKPRLFERKLKEELHHETSELKRLAGLADGLQRSDRELSDARHFHNALFNVMRGGVFESGHTVRAADFQKFAETRNREAAYANQKFLERLPAHINHRDLLSLVRGGDNRQLERIVLEYMPLTFSRRHGDPSRPWNRFEIPSRDSSGNRALNYEGNWRDIFQNWEALAISFPEFLPCMVARFVNASTADGYNPYRIFRDGVDWETADPNDPWSFIGYWGDHQIVYLNRLLEALHGHQPELLKDWLSREIFSYANVPYRIKPFSEMIADPKSTVAFDDAAESKTKQSVKEIGADGKCLLDDQGQPKLVNFAEKLIVPILAKLASFIPEAGIWLNTQRPEWNDANNALVGNGASVVTLCQLRRHLIFCRELFEEAGDSLSISEEVASFFQSIKSVLVGNRTLLRRRFSDADRLKVTRKLGTAGSVYREKIYDEGMSGAKTAVSKQEWLELLTVAIEWTDQSIAANRRRDGLFHSYNLLTFGKGKVEIRRLGEMLEGQVAALGAGFLSPADSVRVLDALRRSKLYRADQHSYLLYPDRDLPRFTDKNVISKPAVRSSRLLRQLIKRGDQRLVECDCAGHLHFNGSIRNRGDVTRILDELRTDGYTRLVNAERKRVLEIFESTFDHQSFTGRSGTFFGYEGLGCIYWHMVSKLLVAVQETFQRAVDSGADKRIHDELAARYFEIRAGLGDMKTPSEYGAFPMDPYSHTPGQGGARQPGLTGQVKEDIICRFGELGITVRNGGLRFDPRLLHQSDFLQESTTLKYFDSTGVRREIKVPANSLAFTICGTPVIYGIAEADRMECEPQASAADTATLALSREASDSVFRRTGEIKHIIARLDRRRFSQ
jgi:hypothetical protein